MSKRQNICLGFLSVLLISCFTHVFHWIANEIHQLFLDRDTLILNAKSIFKKAQLHSNIENALSTHCHSLGNISFGYIILYKELWLIQISHNWIGQNIISIEATKGYLQKLLVKSRLTYKTSHFSEELPLLYTDLFRLVFSSLFSYISVMRNYYLIELNEYSHLGC